MILCRIKSGHIFEVRNRNTGDTDLTDEHRFFFCFTEKYGFCGNHYPAKLVIGLVNNKIL